MIKIINCKKCGGKAYILKYRNAISNNRGNGYHKHTHNFYVKCDNCGNMGKSFESDSNKAIREWNKEQKVK